MIIEVLNLLPWWEWIALFSCVLVGIILLQARPIKVLLLHILSVSFLGVLVTVFDDCRMCIGFTKFTAVLPYVLAMSLGITLAPIWCDQRGIEVDLERKTVTPFSSGIPLFLAVILVIVRAAFGYMTLHYPTTAEQWYGFVYAILFLLIGCLQGSLSGCLNRYAQLKRRASKAVL